MWYLRLGIKIFAFSNYTSDPVRTFLTFDLFVCLQQTS